MAELIHGTAASQQIIAALEAVLTAAKAGRVSGVGVVIVSPLGRIEVTAAGAGEPVYMGCDMLKAQMMQQILNPQQLQRAG